MSFTNESASTREQIRLESLMRMLPRDRRTALEIGARRGFVTRHLTEHFESVTALDLALPTFVIDGVTPVAGDVRHLDFPDNSFDCVICTEVLEHVLEVALAAREIRRVAAHEALIGVPYREDRRIGRMKCSSCGAINPAWGHVNSFDEQALDSLFSGMTVVSREYVGSHRERTNALAAGLSALGGYHDGNYSQDEPCIQCGSVLTRPTVRTPAERVCGAAGAMLYGWQLRLNRPKPAWIHTLFRKN